MEERLRKEMATTTKPFDVWFSLRPNTAGCLKI
jgi:hypothetical protein